jgi:hypothetical protein
MESEANTRQGDYPAGRVLGAVLLVALIFALPGWWLAPRASSSAELADLSDATFVEIRTPDGTVVMSGEFRARVDSVGDIEKDAALLGNRQDEVIGEIEIEIPRRGSNDPRQELEVDIISLQPRSPYQVFINDRPVAAFTTDDRGSVDVEFLSAR